MGVPPQSSYSSTSSTPQTTLPTNKSLVHPQNEECCSVTNTTSSRNRAMSPVKTSHTGSPELPNQKSYRRPRKTSGTQHVNCFVTLPPCRSHLGKHLENQTQHHGHTSGLRKAQYFGNHGTYHCHRKPVSAIWCIRNSLAISQTTNFAVSSRRDLIWLLGGRLAHTG